MEMMQFTPLSKKTAMQGGGGDESSEILLQIVKMKGENKYKDSQYTNN